MRLLSILIFEAFFAAPAWSDFQKIDDTDAVARQAARCSMLAFIGSMGDESEEKVRLAKNFMLFSVELGATEAQRKDWVSEFFSDLKKAVDSKNLPEKPSPDSNFVRQEINACIKLLVKYKDEIKMRK